MSVVVLDFGSQYTRLIARRLRELNALSIVLPGTASPDRIRAVEPAAVVLSGSPRSTMPACTTWVFRFWEFATDSISWSSTSAAVLRTRRGSTVERS